MDGWSSGEGAGIHKVPCYRPVLKLASLCISGSLLEWIRNWLLDHTQRFCINGIVFNSKLVLTREPRGWVLRSWNCYCF